MSFGKPTEVQAIKYAESFVLYGDKTKAIRAAFPESKAAPSSLSVKAVEFHKLVNVQVMINQLHERITGEAEEEALYTARQAIDDLSIAMAMSKDLEQPSPYIQAVMGKSKIAGLLVDRIDQKLKGDVNLQVKEWTVKVVD
jgi:hypothetical protein